jgi:hypothetical protein
MDRVAKVILVFSERRGRTFEPMLASIPEQAFLRAAERNSPHSGFGPPAMRLNTCCPPHQGHGQPSIRALGYVKPDLRYRNFSPA